MKRNALYLVLSGLFILAVGSDVAAQETPSCEVKDTTNIYFGNGVNNTLIQARGSRNAIGMAYIVKLKNDYPEQKFSFFMAYNYSSGVANDVLEVFQQKINEEGGANRTAHEYLQIIQRGSQVDYDDPILDALKDAYLQAIQAKYMLVGTTEGHAQKYRSDLLEGKRVIVFAHSQGNLFANAAVESVIATKPEHAASIGVIGVATPADHVVGSNMYVTAHDDRVIDALRLANTVLDSNIENDPGLFSDPRDFLNHGFTEAYFNAALPSRPLIDTTFWNLIGSLTFPERELGDGALRITLEWGAQPDVDLHVFEPSGDHVYYSNMSGTSGFLDLDDTSGFGPEHYFVSCETIEEGSYQVGVNYYAGTGTETARIQISTLDGRTITRSQVLTTEVGSDGDMSPIMVATVVVGVDSNNQYTFNIQ